MANIIDKNGMHNTVSYNYNIFDWKFSYQLFINAIDCIKYAIKPFNTSWRKKRKYIYIYKDLITPKYLAYVKIKVLPKLKQTKV